MLKRKYASMSRPGRLTRPVGSIGRVSYRHLPAVSVARPIRGVPLRSVKEAGYVDLAYANYAVNTTGTIVLLNTIAQGASQSQRVGKKVALKSLQFKGWWLNGADAVYNYVSMLIVYDKRPTGALPAVTDILNTANAVSFNNDANSGRFVILKRSTPILNGEGDTVALGDGKSMVADFYMSLKGLPQEFGTAGTGAIADITRGALYLVAVGVNPAGSSAATLNGGFRVRYIDV